MLIPACTDDNSSGPVTIETTAPAALVAFRDGSDGPWQALAPTAPTTFQRDVTGPYMVTVVCDDSFGNVTTWQFARTQSDARAIDAPCTASPNNGTATGHMIQAGQVAFGASTWQSDAPDWDFTLESGTGTFDLVASSTDRIVVRRAIAVTGDTPVTPAIDLTQGSALVASPPVTNVSADMLTSWVYLNTKTTFTNIYNGAATATKVAPTELLLDTDHQSVSVDLVAPAGSRWAYRDHFKSGDARPFTLPEALGAVQFAVTNGQLAAKWSTLPDHDSIDASVFGNSADLSKFWFHDIEISAAFVAATGVTSMPFDVTIPGYKTEWKVDLTSEYEVDLSAMRHDGDDTTGASAHQDFNMPSSRASRLDSYSPGSLRRSKRRPL